MARNVLTRASTLDEIINTIYSRLRRLERPNVTHYGGVGSGYTISIDKTNGNLISTSDITGNVTIIGSP